MKKLIKMKGKLETMQMASSSANAVEATIEDIVDPGYWRNLVPFLTVRVGEDHVFQFSQQQEHDFAHHDISTHQHMVRTHGYTVVRPDEMMPSDADNIDNVLDNESTFTSSSSAVAASSSSTSSSSSSQQEEACCSGIIKNKATRYKALIQRLSSAAFILHENGWPAPATFLAVYDEAWELAQICQRWMDLLTGKQNRFCFDIVGFHVVDGAGFSPHRDRQPEDWMPKGHLSEDPRTTFSQKDGMARYLTCWVALTDATPEKSCLHYVSATVDPGYYDGDAADEDNSSSSYSSTRGAGAAPGPMEKIFKEKDAFQKIFCASVNAGGFCCHTHRVVHWGNQGTIGELQRRRSEDAVGGGDHDARVAISFAFTNNKGTSFEPPNLLPRQGEDVTVDRIRTNSASSANSNYISCNVVTPPSDFGVRVALCAAQVINYSTLSLGDPRGWRTLAGKQLGKKDLLKFYRVFQRKESLFHAHYRKEISGKFVAVSLEVTTCGSPGPCATTSCRTTTGSSSSSAMEATSTSSSCSTSAALSSTTATVLSSSSSSTKKRKKVATMKKKKRKATPGGSSTKKKKIIGISSKPKGSLQEQDSGDDLEDAALEAMLDAEMGTKSILFHDDFDLLAAQGGC
ncbi:unnamed protein product [Amoebophrya sp. A25]|nr:unnamed protein product [Amoebophrya sp. A25]|eukprot:GSA25T00017861001.1